MRPRLLAIVGPTAVGKTRLGVEIAHRLGSEILSADSRQVYRGLDLGTGKDLEEYTAVDPPVTAHLLDIVDVETVYTLALFLEDARRVLAEVSRSPWSDRAPLVVVGGSGLYVEALLRDFDVPRVAPNPRLRAELEEEDLTELVRRLRGQAPVLAAQTDLTSARRVIRALEIHAAVGDLRPARRSRPVVDARVVGIACPRDRLRARIARRVHQRLEAGMVEEVRELLDRGVPRSRLDALGLEYREIAAYLEGEVAWPAMVERLITRIRQFAKRQMTWFRGMERRGLPVTWIEPGEVDEAFAVAAELMSRED